MSPERPRGPRAVLIRDDQACVPLGRILSDGDLLYLFTPAAVPLETIAESPPEDPFEAFGRALTKHHRWVRHVPYLPRDGITDYHVTHMGFAKVIIFVISGPPRQGQRSQAALLEEARSAGAQHPQIVLACCRLEELGPIQDKFPTVIEISSYSRNDLESAAELLFGGGQAPRMVDAPLVRSPNPVQQRWVVEPWQIVHDMSAMYDLWCQCLPDQFQLNRVTLQFILSGDGYCQNYVVRNQGTREVLGFCSTFVTYLYNDKRCLGSLAAIIVKPSHRRQGIGSHLHAYAMSSLERHGVVRHQLGSTFPRLLRGLPLDLESENWFKHLGWRFNQQNPGTGQEVCDWLLNMEEWNTENLSSSGLSFRLLELSESQREYDEVMEFVGKESTRKDNMGFYNVYSRLQHTPHMGDIMLGFEGTTLVATAITYTPRGGSPVANEIPWPGAIGEDVGGVACVCIADDHTLSKNTRTSVVIRLLDACVKSLRQQGMRRMFLDGMKGGAEGFQSIGFQKWARYSDVWRDVD